MDLDALQAAVGEDTAGLMLTNPNTVGLFDPNIKKITEIIHKAGGLCYYDGANLNAVVGLARPGDMGFDIVHVNLHKTFSTPHGMGGPGSGPVGCKAFLSPFLPGRKVVEKDGALTFETAAQSYGSVRAFYGNFLVICRALTYIIMLGSDGLPEVAKNAVLNANYMMAELRDLYKPAYDRICKHEFVVTLEDMKRDMHVTALDIAKALLDHGIHPPTMYFPLIVKEALMIEPCETEGKETLDAAIAAFREIYEEAKKNPDAVRTSPHTTPIGRPDEVAAARKPVLSYSFGPDKEQ